MSENSHGPDCPPRAPECPFCGPRNNPWCFRECVCECHDRKEGEDV